MIHFRVIVIAVLSAVVALAAQDRKVQNRRISGAEELYYLTDSYKWAEGVRERLIPMLYLTYGDTIPQDTLWQVITITLPRYAEAMKKEYVKSITNNFSPGQIDSLKRIIGSPIFKKYSELAGRDSKILTELSDTLVSTFRRMIDQKKGQ